MASAQVQASPAQITLNWLADANATSYTISRRQGNSWTTVATLGGGANTWTDSSVQTGTPYEYRLQKTTSAGYPGIGYVYAGINAPLKESRGKLVLLVDNTYASALDAELQRLEWDLAGDGWTVLRHDVSRNDSVPNIKNIIKADYYADPANVNTVFLFGHVPVPYSGNFNPDGHDNHQGACPADVYYGDMDGTWTDSSVNNGGAEREANRNYPGDGKFDQSFLPSDVELAVGRVDLSNMTCFSNKTPSRSELDLLRQYLNKDHNFRHRVFTLPRRGLICDNWGERQGEAFAASGWRNFAPFFGAGNVTAVGGWNYFPTMNSEGYLWSWGGGGGGYTTCDGVGGSDDFANGDIKGVFTMFLGSYFGDWDNESAFLRAPLGSTTYCLTASWAGRPHWFFHHMGLGETIGYSTRLTQNNGGDTYMASIVGDRSVIIGLMGDPTLRLHPVIPVSNLKGSASGSSMTLSWNGSSDSNIQGYHVYRGSGPTGSFVRLTSSPITSTGFTDTGYSPGATYMVRAIKLEQSGSGTYYNASQGIFYPQSAPITGGGSSPLTPAAPANIAATSMSASQISISWDDKSNDETSFRIDRKTGSAGTWAQIGQAQANASSFTDSGLAPGTTYYYRVFALNSAGASLPSNEISATTSVPNQTPAAAVFAGVDGSASGNWKGVYGKEGYNIITGPSSYPGYVSMNSNGGTPYQWSDYTTETRALQTGSGTARVSGCWFAPKSFTVDLSFLDGVAHKLSLYFCDWDRLGRIEKVEVLDASSGAVLDSQMVTDFQNGVYLSWNVKGTIRLRFTSQTTSNAVVQGLFFDAGTPITSGGTSTKAGGVISGQFQLQLAGVAGDKFDIYCSDNLSTWTKIQTVTLTDATYNFLDSTSQGKALRFYRAVRVP
jgi:hypothetical protein